MTPNQFHPLSDPLTVPRFPIPNSLALAINPYPHPFPLLTPSHQPTHLFLLLLAAAALTSPPTVGLLHVVELPRVAVITALATPGKAAATAVPACAALLELEAAGGGRGLVGGWGSEGAGHGSGGEEDDVELHVEVLVFKGGSKVVGVCCVRRLMLLMPPLSRSRRPYLYPSPPSIHMPDSNNRRKVKFLKLHILPRELSVMPV